MMGAEAENIHVATAPARPSRGSIEFVPKDAKSITVATGKRGLSVEHISEFVARLEVIALVQSRHMLTGDESVQHLVLFGQQSRLLSRRVCVLVQVLSESVLEVVRLRRRRGRHAADVLFVLDAVCGLT